MANEKRLDLIDRNALLKKMQNWNTKERLINCVEDAPTVDAVEVVRCKDCKHCKKYRNRLDPMLNHQLCVRLDTYGWGVDEDDFCSYGERRNDV